ncbi:MAG: thioredoxin 1 [Candidatus Paceibacteria bacterium]
MDAQAPSDHIPRLPEQTDCRGFRVTPQALLYNDSSFDMSNALDVTDSSWESTVLQSDTPVLVDFWAEWCGPCKAMGPLVDKLAEDLGEKIKVVKLNTQDNPEVPGRYGIVSIPTFMLIKDGEVVHQMLGSMPYPSFKSEVEGKL